MTLCCLHLEAFQVRITLIVCIIDHGCPWFICNEFLYAKDIIFVVIACIEVRNIELPILQDDEYIVLISELSEETTMFFVIDSVDIWIKPNLSSAQC